MKSTTTERTSKKSSSTAARRPRATKRAAGQIAQPKTTVGSIRQRLNQSIEAAAQINRKQLACGLAGTAAVGAGAYFLYRSWSSGSLASFVRDIEERFGLVDAEESMNTDVPESLPLGVSGHKPSPSIRDHEGNYDIDGVSFDEQGVIVGSDNEKAFHAPN